MIYTHRILAPRMLFVFIVNVLFVVQQRLQVPNKAFCIDGEQNINSTATMLLSQNLWLGYVCMSDTYIPAWRIRWTPLSVVKNLWIWTWPSFEDGHLL